jgi:hypothetical protein
MKNWTTEAACKENHGVRYQEGFMGPSAGVEYNLTLCPLQSRPQHICYGHLMPESTLTLCQSRLYPPVRDFVFDLCTLYSVQCSVHCLSGRKFTHPSKFHLFLSLYLEQSSISKETILL